MPRGHGRLDVHRVTVADIERAVRHQHCLRVGATNDPLARAQSYEQRGVNGRFFIGRFLYVPARNARTTEDHLLAVAWHCGTARLNAQRTSNYQDVPGYVYVILGRPVPPPGHPAGYGGQPNDCCLM